jgi:molybdopterin-guanine dinucleotide biosynthesis protein A
MSGDIPQSPRWSALLMAGGESRRMGRDKALLELGGEPLWRRQLRTLREASFQEIIVARGPRACLDEPGLIMVTDAESGRGPLGGLVAGLRRATAPWVLVLAVDLPLMPSWFLQGMMAMAETDGRGVAPTIDVRYEPLAAVYPSVCLEFAEEALANKVWSLQALLQRCVLADLMRSVSMHDEKRDYFRNVNTPEDLAEIEERLAKERGRGSNQ